MNRFETAKRVIEQKRRAFRLATAISLGSGALAGCVGNEVGSATTTLGQTQPSGALAAKHTLGNDVSLDQCGKTLPINQEFGIVGVNGNYPVVYNSCFKDEYKWAQKSKGNGSHPKVSLYVTANNTGPKYKGKALMCGAKPCWPDSGTNTYGKCVPVKDTNYGVNDRACAFEYGVSLASKDVKSTNLANIGTVYIDIENVYTWGSVASNVAVAEGMTTELESKGADVGVYSDSDQYEQLIGKINSGILNKLREWVFGGGNLKGALEDCALKPFSAGGKIVLSQYTPNSSIDNDTYCN